MWIISAIIAVSLTTSAFSQQKSLKDQLVGTWTLESVSEVYPDGKTEHPWGPAVKGAVNFAPNGKVMLMIIGGDLPSPSGKPQESNRQVVAYFGTYAVDDAANTVTYTAERATIPVFDGLARKASVNARQVGPRVRVHLLRRRVRSHQCPAAQPAQNRAPWPRSARGLGREKGTGRSRTCAPCPFLCRPGSMPRLRGIW
jgi:hypothetical protein